MKKLPIGLQTFSELIRDNYVYVDKTKIIYELISTGKYYFLARPRRFGKSLLVSTLGDIFSGNKDLFKGLAISSLPYDWKQYPVIKISFSDIPCSTPEEFKKELRHYLLDIAKHHNIALDDGDVPARMLREIVKQLSDKNLVVLLIDEYDYPILRHLHEGSIADKMREILKDFYIVIKGLDEYLRFVLLTGVSKFAKTSVFSGLNNLEDISLAAQYNDLAGYTKNEISIYFKEHLTLSAEKMKISFEQLFEKITIWYDGYRFAKDAIVTKIYNPFSVMLCLKNSDFSNYWFATGTPTFLINLLKVKQYPLQSFESVKASEGELGQFDIEDIDLKVLMFQTGYLSIKAYNPETRNYTLGYANKETMDSLAELAIKSMSDLPRAQVYEIVVLLLKAFEKNDLKQLEAVLTELFASVPYTIQIGEEKYYQTIFYLILKMVGADIIVEYPTNIGRLDAVVQTKNSFFIVEFKINSTASKAIQQIEDKKYYQPYLSRGKNIILVGIAFDTIMKNVSSIEYKTYK